MGPKEIFGLELDFYNEHPNIEVHAYEKEGLIRIVFKDQLTLAALEGNLDHIGNYNSAHNLWKLVAPYILNAGFRCEDDKEIPVSHVAEKMNKPYYSRVISGWPELQIEETETLD